MAQTEIECQALEVVFANRGNKQTILDGLDLTVPAGQIVTLLGPSGCGKSTLLRVVAGLTKPTSGSLCIEGKSIRENQHKLAFVFQESALLPWRSVYQNVRLPWEIRKAPAGFDLDSAIQNVLELVGFKPNDWNKKPHQLSGGMKMRASIARALITKPDILLLDEPFAALDDMLRSKLNDLLLKIVEQTHTTMLFVTHNIAEAIYLSHSIAVFSQGKIGERIDVDLPTPRQASVRSSPEFAAMYGRVSESLARNASA
jgi:NitT/TauT family transport system ATP-binding protein